MEIGKSRAGPIDRGEWNCGLASSCTARARAETRSLPLTLANVASDFATAVSVARTTFKHNLARLSGSGVIGMYCPQCGTHSLEYSKFCHGCGATLPAAEVSALEGRQSSVATSSSPSSAESPSSTAAERMASRHRSNVRPWVRYWARMTDMYVFAILFGMIWEILAPGSLDATNEILFGVFVTLVWVPVESFFLAMWGATPARALLRMHVVRLESGNRMNYGQAFGRSANVWIRGIGVGIPLITLIRANYRLFNRGVSSWDEAANTAVLHEKIGFVRVFFATLIWVTVIGLIVIGSYQ